MTTQRWRVRSLPIPRAADLGTSRLLLALVMQRGSYPNNVRDVAQRFGVNRATVRAWRSQLVSLGLVVDRGDVLEVDAKSIERWKTEQAQKLAAQGIPWTCDALPWSCLRRPKKNPNANAPPKLTPRQMLAAAVMVGEAWSHRSGIRTDAERAAVAGVGISTVSDARRLLIELELLDVEIVRRGNAKRLVRLVWRKKASHGSPLSQQHAAELALRASRGRLRRATEVVAEQRAEVVAEQRTPERPTDVPRTAKPAPEPRTLRTGWGEKLEHLAKHLGHRRPHARKQQRNRATIAAALLTEHAATKLARMTPTLACDQALLAVGAWAETAKQRRNAVAALTAHYGRKAVGMVLSVIADALLDDVRDLGAVVAHRCRRLTTSKAQTTVAEHRRSWGLSRLLREAREHAQAA